MRYRGILFDLDGVICSTDHFHTLAWRQLAKEHRLPFDESVGDRLRGVSRMESLRIVLGALSAAFTQEQQERMAERKNDIYRRYLETMTPADLSPGVRETLDLLRSRGCLLAIGSSSKNTPLILERIGLSAYFDAVSDGNGLEHSKPHPEVFQKAAQSLGLPPTSCLVVEDAEAGVQAALSGGFDSAGLGPAARAPGVTYSITGIPDLIPIVTG